MRGAKVGCSSARAFAPFQETQNQARDTNPFDYFYSKPTPDPRRQAAPADIPSASITKAMS